ncbi:hypothetical protein PGT21_034389 [Puccinia graminis f. sp. tritici]|uniref:Uncharacterized protein n=1 Tax=Puccinia graminis f. sp. tritici TaxID=56615 RepID=A0A5B0M922_PUCGR|nr:hypothetical protein PGT21_034389 [Puccinia graminis f. sp. tritici]
MGCSYHSAVTNVELFQLPQGDISVHRAPGGTSRKRGPGVIKSALYPGIETRRGRGSSTLITPESEMDLTPGIGHAYDCQEKSFAADASRAGASFHTPHINPAEPLTAAARDGNQPLDLSRHTFGTGKPGDKPTEANQPAWYTEKGMKNKAQGWTIVRSFYTSLSADERSGAAEVKYVKEVGGIREKERRSPVASQRLERITKWNRALPSMAKFSGVTQENI